MLKSPRRHGHLQHSINDSLGRTGMLASGSSHQAKGELCSGNNKPAMRRIVEKSTDAIGQCGRGLNLVFLGGVTMIVTRIH
jgi:hypothetical protein